ncbi:MAG: hypothetical protein KIS87_12955 [Phycisphaeraceae bacterium]|nr:hypothetical protein [Phycisphaeraceae bacterium]
MSAGPRLPLEHADAAAAFIMRCWGLEPPAAVVVGSVRRREPEVGDLEIIAPAADPSPLFGGDPLCERLLACVGSRRPDNMPEVTPLRGLKPGFAAASMTVSLYDVGGRQMLHLPVQIFRYEPGNRGWHELMRTGPADFGRWFLTQWKRVHRIPHEQPASVNGWLVDASGERVIVERESDCFREINLPVCPPERRRAFAESQAAAREARRDHHAHTD